MRRQAKNSRSTLRLFVGAISLAGLTTFLLTACAEEHVSVDYSVVNHTNIGVVEITVNGRGGVLVAHPQAASGRACCVSVPRRWVGDLRASIGWQDDSTRRKDSQGKDIIRDGLPVLIEGAKYERVVALEAYAEADIGTMYIHIMPDRSVIARLSRYSPSHPDYRPINPTQGLRP